MLRTLLAPVAMAALFVGQSHAQTDARVEVFTCPETVTTGVSSELKGGWSFPGGETLRVDEHIVSGETLICRYENQVNLLHKAPVETPDCTAVKTATKYKFECTPKVEIFKSGSVFLSVEQAVDFETKTVDSKKASSDLRLTKGLYLEAINGAKIHAKGRERLSKSRCAELANPFHSGTVIAPDSTPPSELLVTADANKLRNYCLVTKEGLIGAIQLKGRLNLADGSEKVLMEYWLWK